MTSQCPDFFAVDVIFLISARLGESGMAFAQA